MASIENESFRCGSHSVAHRRHRGVPLQTACAARPHAPPRRGWNERFEWDLPHASGHLVCAGMREHRCLPTRLTLFATRIAQEKRLTEEATHSSEALDFMYVMLECVALFCG